ncbi:MAG: hypothetical protein ACRD3D_09275 [Terriglobia bacterium]
MILIKAHGQESTDRGYPLGSIMWNPTISGANIGSNTSATFVVIASLANASSGLTILATSPASNGQTNVTVDNP